MTPREFKAWFDGFTEAFSGVPTKTQWARIKARVAEIDGSPITERVFVDRYWPTSYPVYPAPIYWANKYATYCLSNQGSHAINASVGDFNLPQSQSFNSTSAMYALGKAEAAQ